MLPDFGGIVVVENNSFLDLVFVACWTGFLSVYIVWHSWRIFSKQSIQKVGDIILLTIAMIRVFRQLTEEARIRRFSSTLFSGYTGDGVLPM